MSGKDMLKRLQAVNSNHTVNEVSGETVVRSGKSASTVMFEKLKSASKVNENVKSVNEKSVGVSSDVLIGSVVNDRVGLTVNEEAVVRDINKSTSDYNKMLKPLVEYYLIGGFDKSTLEGIDKGKFLIAANKFVNEVLNGLI